MVVHDDPAHDEGDRVPHGVSVPADQALSEEGHQESRGLDCNQGVVAEIHELRSWDQMSADSTELVEGIAKGYRPGHIVVV